VAIETGGGKRDHHPASPGLDRKHGGASEDDDERPVRFAHDTLARTDEEGEP
jgi:hypothetical protein